MKDVYLDFAASTPIDKIVLKNYISNLQKYWANPSSTHVFGREVKYVLEDARERAARIIGASSNEIFFGSSVTNVNNLVLHNFIDNDNSIICYNFEHSSIVNLLKKQSQKVLEINSTGVVDLEEIFSSVTSNTRLICLMYVNNTLGTIQPVEELANRLLVLNQSRIKAGMSKIYLFCDFSAACNYFDCNVEKLGVDFLSFGSSKIYAPKGSALLYVKNGVKLESKNFGGFQESGYFPGTENTPSILAMIDGMELASKNRVENSKKIYQLCKLVIDFCKEKQYINIVGHNSGRTGIFSLVLLGFEKELILTSLDLQGFAISSGSACNSGAILDKDFTIKGLKHNNIIRVSLSHLNTASQVIRFLKSLSLFVETGLD
jgi:cysteine desulfurase